MSYKVKFILTMVAMTVAYVTTVIMASGLTAYCIRRYHISNDVAATIVMGAMGIHFLYSLYIMCSDRELHHWEEELALMGIAWTPMWCVLTAFCIGH